VYNKNEQTINAEVPEFSYNQQNVIKIHIRLNIVWKNITVDWTMTQRFVELLVRKLYMSSQTAYISCKVGHVIIFGWTSITLTFKNTQLRVLNPLISNEYALTYNWTANGPRIWMSCHIVQSTLSGV